MHPVLAKDNVAVVTGGASGIGLEIVGRLVALGMKVAIADLPGPALERAAAETGALGVAVDVTDRAALEALKVRVERELGPVSALFANAAIQPGSDVFDERGTWNRVIDVNLMGLVHTVQVLAPAMIASGAPGLIVMTGSKQGITTPPGDPAYNAAKAGVKAFAEAVQHDLRGREGCEVEARLLIPGFVWTGLTRQGRTEKPAGAWTPEQLVDFLMAALDRDDFYILCPDNDVDRATDEKRILWAAGDIVENRPPLSRWHGDYDAAFKAWLER
ncbi:SDR family oxidoreductase [Sagittula sp. MA-2]|uniref:SDR family oxidoreductase n=1 Tax=Sagittula sp. MA-2 TaxID=3048007 RepID=UPI0024C2684B|nr:SDR family NAD(P)-dependent oxidoreductase [Sagittula sp. MA-2]WHZ35977.1 SDR family NAD(P)-dependent oxidoreductase [Sagittula sp. MA-2]